MDDRTASLLKEGEVAARAGQKDEARRTFQEALRLDPDNVTALLWLAGLDRDPQTSLAYAEHALARVPDDATAQAALKWARERAQRSASRRRWSWVATATTLCLLLVVASGALTGLFPVGPLPVAASIPTAIPTATATATLTPTPADTPTPIPTWTPTFTPSPTPTPTPTLLTTTTPVPTITTVVPPLTVPTLDPSAIHGDTHWIDVDLTNQTLSAYEGQELVRFTLVSTGLPRTPTPTGLFHIHTKMRYDDMEGPDYYLRNVPYVMYFYKGYALHGTYWHANFGRPASHGCVNLPTEHAAWLYEWAEVGTLVSIHE
jgi:lipoprotein-anchoring transpeptidase ErfK/SrfK